jgi:hypothetical protein
MLKSEKYVGDVYMQKYYTPDCMTHKSVRNNGELPMFYKRNHHPAIIARENWDEVQRQLILRRYKRAKKFKPEKKFTIKKIKSGIFQGFSVINPKWNKSNTATFLQKINDERGHNNDAF